MKIHQISNRRFTVGVSKFSKISKNVKNALSTLEYPYEPLGGSKKSNSASQSTRHFFLSRGNPYLATSEACIFKSRGLFILRTDLLRDQGPTCEPNISKSARAIFISFEIMKAPYPQYILGIVAQPPPTLRPADLTCCELIFNFCDHFWDHFWTVSGTIPGTISGNISGLFLGPFLGPHWHHFWYHF